MSDTCEHILQKNEFRNIEYNESVFGLVLQEFLKASQLDFNFNNLDGVESSKVLAIKEQYIYTSKYVELFFKILELYGYNMRQEIKDALFRLCHLENPRKNKEEIKTSLKSPVIQDISFNGEDKFTIFSEKYGEYVAKLATKHFKDNSIMSEYLRTRELPRRCHNHPYFMSRVFPTFYSVTSLCKSYFKDNYYHSYAYDPSEDVVIDLCYNAVFSKGIFNSLYVPQVISTVRNSDVEKELAITNIKTDQPFDRCALLKIALFKQYLSAINYNGPLETAPSLKM